MGDQPPDAKLLITSADKMEGREKKGGVLVGHDVPFVEEGNESSDIEFNFFGSRGTTHSNVIVTPPFLIELSPQDFQEFSEILTVGGIGDIPIVAVVDAIVGEIFPVDTDAFEARPLRE